MFGYDQHGTHARNANTLCASLTMRREIIATRRAGVTTAVVTETPPKGVHHMLAHDRKDVGLHWGTRFNISTTTNKLEGHRTKVKKLENFRIISTTSENRTGFI